MESSVNVFSVQFVMSDNEYNFLTYLTFGIYKAGFL